ncbi:MAG: putative holin [Halopseudomonas sp.]|uniref:putative holin n=1 Tax=Halopseudomonas sp. TaxID=2901191 RepID=UPI003002E43E
MPEPTSSTAVAITAGTSIGLATLLPWVDANALMGAVLGAALVAYAQKDLKAWQRLGGLIFSAMVGYLMSTEVVAQTPINETGPGAFIGAIVIVPLGLKLMEWVGKLEIATLFKRGNGG